MGRYEYYMAGCPYCGGIFDYMRKKDGAGHCSNHGWVTKDKHIMVKDDNYDDIYGDDMPDCCMACGNPAYPDCCAGCDIFED